MATAATAALFAAAAALGFGGIDEWVEFDSLQVVEFGDVGDEGAGVGVGVAQEVEHGGLVVEKDFAVDDGQVDVGLGQDATAFFDQAKRQFLGSGLVSFGFVGCCHSDDFSSRFVAVVLRGEVFGCGENFAEFLASVSLQDDSVTMLAFDLVDVAEDSDPAERSISNEVAMDSVVTVCRGGALLRKSFTVDFDRAVGDSDSQRGHGRGRIRQSFAGFQIKLPVVPRARHRAAIDRSVAKRRSLVRALAFDREQIAL